MAGKPKHYTAMNDLNGDTIALELSSCALERCGCVCHYALAIMWRKFCLSASHCVLGYSQPHHLVTSATRSLRVRLEMDVLYGVRVNARTVVTYEEWASGCAAAVSGCKARIFVEMGAVCTNYAVGKMVVIMSEESCCSRGLLWNTWQW